MNLVVPVGNVQFIFYDNNKKLIDNIIIGEKNYSRITVPPKIWFGFKGLSSSTSYILNVSDVSHDPSEIERKPLSFLVHAKQYESYNPFGGFGTRISIYLNHSKTMIRVGGKPIIEHIMEIYRNMVIAIFILHLVINLKL